MSKLIAMLTHNDVTVPGATETFLACKDLPVKYWRFKDHGTEPDKMKELTQCMKDNRRTTSLEVISYTEAECMRGTKLAMECGSDYLVGTISYDGVFEYIKTTDLKYYPFIGTVAQNPSIPQGVVQEMLDQEAMFAEKGYMGTDLLGYRYVDGDPAAPLTEYIAKAKKPIILIGNIGSDERAAEVLKVNPRTFTMGSALFAKKFVGDGNFRQSLEYVLGLLKRVGTYRTKHRR